MANAHDKVPTGAQRLLDGFSATTRAQRKLPYYEVLGVAETATQAQIVRTYRSLSLKLHPDKPGGSTEKFQELSRAYKCLKDPNSRRKYDDCGFDEDSLDTEEVDVFVDAFFGESARAVDGRSGDWSANSISNYNYVDLTQVPLHMKDIVRIGLTYIVALDHDFENVVLLQHSRIDILYLMVGLWDAGDLTQELFGSEKSYSLTYYDNPLQPGICPRWSDQNRLNGRTGGKHSSALPTRELNFEEFQRRQKIALAMIENAPADPMAALEEKYRIQMIETQRQRALTADEKRREALRGQDVYDDDAELDCNAYSDFLSIERCIESSQAQETLFQEAEKAMKAEQAESVTKYASQGKEEVLGFNSDGILFVATGGQVLRNEGPLMPSRDKSASSLELKPVVSSATACCLSGAIKCCPRLGNIIWS